jgi:hypothetical protein
METEDEAVVREVPTVFTAIWTRNVEDRIF